MERLWKKRGIPNVEHRSKRLSEEIYGTKSKEKMVRSELIEPSVDSKTLWKIAVEEKNYNPQ